MEEEYIRSILSLPFFLIGTSVALKKKLFIKQTRLNIIDQFGFEKRSNSALKSEIMLNSFLIELKVMKKR